MAQTSTDRARKSLAKKRAVEAAGRAIEAEQQAAAPARYTDQQRRDLDRWKFHHGQFIQENLWVPHIDGGRVVPFDLNPGQREVDQAIEAMRAEEKPVRILVLKSRKQGISTYCQGVGYGFVSTREYVNGLIILDTKDKSGKILDLAKKFHMLDERRALGMRPVLEASNRLELKFGNPDFRTRERNPGLQSRLEISSADSKDPGRSGTYQFIHASEVAFWADDSVWASAGNALMYAPDTIAIMETTANGCAGLFYDTWNDAVAGKSEWMPVFLSWLTDPRCRRVVGRLEREHWEWQSPDEREYAEEHRLTLEQAKFRRVMLRDPSMRKAGKVPEDVFDEEYPATPDLAFKSTGKSFFLAKTLGALEKDPVRGVREPIFRGSIRNKTNLEHRTPGNFARVPIEVILQAEPFGPLRIWEHPRDDCEYVVGCDVAEGLAHGDNHFIAVMKRHTRDVVATWKTNRATSRVAGQVACLLGWHYGTALVGIELNAHGVAATQEAVRICYPHLWHHRDVRKEGDAPQDRVGWNTTEGVRTYMLECVEFEIQALAIGLHSEEFYGEARTFENIDGKPQARPGKKDDEIMGTAITFQMHLHSGPPRKIPEADRPAKAPRVLTPETPEQGKVPIRAVSGRLRHVGNKGLWGEESY
jgi:hypothetical protein